MLDSETIAKIKEIPEEILDHIDPLKAAILRDIREQYREQT